MLKIFLSKKVLGPIIIMLVFFSINLILNNIVKKILKSKLTNDKKRKKTMVGLINNIIKYFLLLISILMILSIYGIDTSALITSLGVVGVVAGLAVQDLLKDFLAGITIIFEDQYSVGDTVTINGFKGEVLSVGLKTTKLKAYTGEIKFLANRNIVEVTNHSLAPSLAIVDISVSYEDDITKVEQIISELCARLTKELKEIKSDVTFLGIENLAASSVDYRIQVETMPLKHCEIRRKMLRELKIELDKNKITIPYEQMVVHNARV